MSHETSSRSTRRESAGGPEAQEYDVLVIGGGIHGVGVAQAAAAAGHSVLVLEQSGLADGTSSRSSKLIHGGLRYLETLDLRLVRESLQERELLLRNAPGLVHRQPFLIPVYPQTTRGPWKLRAGLALYWILAGMRSQTGFAQIPKRRWRDLDGLRTDQLRKVMQYWDAQTDDKLLTQSVMQSAEQLGAQLRCPAELVEARVTACGCVARYHQQGQTHPVHAAVLVNAAGPWARDVVRRITPSPPAPRVDLVQGTHLELPGEIVQGCYYVEAPQDRRAVFVMPWKGHTLVGTTERLYEGDPSECVATDSEVAYLRETYRHFFPNRSLEVISQWAGLRVLPAGDGAANRRSRETQLPVDNLTQPRVLSIFGGKLTGYRATAERVMEILRPSLPQRRPIADTRTLRLELPTSSAARS